MLQNKDETKTITSEASALVSYRVLKKPKVRMAYFWKALGKIPKGMSDRTDDNPFIKALGKIPKSVTDQMEVILWVRITKDVI